MLTRYDDVSAAFLDSETYSNAAQLEAAGATVGSTLMNMDGDEHRKRRNIVGPVFVGKHLKALMRVIQRNLAALVQGITKKHASRIAEQAAQKGEIDIVDEFATRLPLNVILDVLDLPQESHKLSHDWYPAIISGMVRLDYVEAGRKANAEFHAFLDPLIDERTRNPGEDLISRLIHAEVDGHQLSREELKSFSSLLFVAGAEATDKAIGNLWYWLLSNPDQRNAVQEDPDLLDKAFFEMMRIHPPAPAQEWTATRDISLHGQVIPEGSLVTLSIYGANRDERVFKDPDTFNIFREDLDLKYGRRRGGQAGHLGFGAGPHFCTGYHLAQIETVLGTRELMKVIKKPRFKPGTHPSPINIRAEPWELVLEFDRA